MPSKNTVRMGDEGKAARRRGAPAALLSPNLHASQEMDLSAATFKILGSHASAIHTSHARHSNVSNSVKPPIFGIKRTNRRIASPQLGQHGAG